MEWKKSNISQSELEKQQQAYIKEALEMAKRSVASQFEKAAEIEKAKAEREAAEKIEAERIAAEKAEAERVAAEKAEAERIVAEKAEAERIAAEKAEAERIVAEKTEAETLKEELTSYCGTNEEADKYESCLDQCLNLSDKDDIIDVTEVKKAMEPSEAQNKSRQRTMTQNGAANKKPSSPPNFNRFINEHNKSQCNCPNCQKRRAEQQR